MEDPVVVKLSQTQSGMWLESGTVIISVRQDNLAVPISSPGMDDRWLFESSSAL